MYAVGGNRGQNSSSPTTRRQHEERIVQREDAAVRPSAREVRHARQPPHLEAQRLEDLLGQRDGASVEVSSGLKPGERVATSNSFALKAELSKPTDED